jgi:hypothetical protein
LSSFNQRLQPPQDEGHYFFFPECSGTPQRHLGLDNTSTPNSTDVPADDRSVATGIERQLDIIFRRSIGDEPDTPSRREDRECEALRAQDVGHLFEYRDRALIQEHAVFARGIGGASPPVARLASGAVAFLDDPGFGLGQLQTIQNK